jgi:cholesterol oxidase
VTRYDVIVVGSGFGGSVVACRLAEAGARVLVLERGRRWTPDQFPRQPQDAWLYDNAKPHQRDGWVDLRLYRGMTVVQGAGVGGGSLCYSSVLLPPDATRFADGWPPEITAAELAPHDATVNRMLGAQRIPKGQHTRRYRLLEQGAERLGLSQRFSSVPLAISFDPQWNYDLPDALDPRHSQTFVNDQGQQQGTCVHLGNCDIGCDVRAKNTLDLNYIPAAERRGAEVRPRHLVRYIQPEDGGYGVVFDRIEGGRLVRGVEQASRVVLAAGSLGSTELLLRCRDQYRTLPNISRALGERWSANANFFTLDFYPSAADVEQGVGPTISGGLDFTDGSVAGQRFVVEDDGFPDLLRNAVTAKLRANRLSLLAWALRYDLRGRSRESNAFGNVMIWLGAGVDAADGRLSLGRNWLAPWSRELKLAWDAQGSRGAIEAIISIHKQLSQANGGLAHVPWLWSVLRSLVTVHPLGGCMMGTTADNGVVDHRGEVFGHSNLYVADGSIVPRPIGLNPSLTIAALAERTSALMAKT